MLALGIVVVFFVLAVFMKRGLPLYSASDPIEITSLYVAGEEVTSDVDEAQIIPLIRKVYKSFIFDFSSGYVIEEDTIEINLQANQQQMHLVLGQRDFCYVSGHGMKFYLNNTEELKQFIWKMRESAH